MHTLIGDGISSTMAECHIRQWIRKTKYSLFLIYSLFFSTLFFGLFLGQQGPLCHLFGKVVTDQAINDFLYMFDVFFSRRIRCFFEIFHSLLPFVRVPSFNWYQSSLSDPKRIMSRQGDASSQTSGNFFEGTVLNTRTRAPKVGDVTLLVSFHVLSKANNPLWANRLEVLLEAHGLLEAIEVECVASKKDCQALSILLRAIPQEILAQLNIKTSLKEIQETIRNKNVDIE